MTVKNMIAVYMYACARNVHIASHHLQIYASGFVPQSSSISVKDP